MLCNLFKEHNEKIARHLYEGPYWWLGIRIRQELSVQRADVFRCLPQLAARKWIQFKRSLHSVWWCSGFLCESKMKYRCNVKQLNCSWKTCKEDQQVKASLVVECPQALYCTQSVEWSAAPTAVISIYKWCRPQTWLPYPADVSCVVAAVFMLDVNEKNKITVNS